MNFSPFGGHFAGSIPAVHQFTAKFAHNAPTGLPPQAVTTGAVVVTGGDGIQYIRTDHTTTPAHFTNQSIIGMPLNMGKYRPPDTSSQQVNSQSVAVMNPNTKYHVTSVPIHHFHQGATGVPAGASIVAVPYSQAAAMQQQQQQQQTTATGAGPGHSTTNQPTSSPQRVTVATVQHHSTSAALQQHTSVPNTQTSVPITQTSSVTNVSNPQNSVPNRQTTSMPHQQTGTIPTTPPTSMSNPQTSLSASQTSVAISQSSGGVRDSQQTVQNNQTTTVPNPQQSPALNVRTAASTPTSAANVLQQSTPTTQNAATNTHITEKQFVAAQIQAQNMCTIMVRGNGVMEAEKATQTPRDGIKLEDEKSEDRDTPGIADFSGAVMHATAMPATWQSLAAPGSTVADYLSRLPASTLPLSLHHFLKYSAENIKKEPETTTSSSSTTNPPTKKKSKKKKKPPKPRMRPGQVHLTTALDGTTLFCCPECHMAYPEKELLEQHLVGHKIERRFICDICGAGLKRKEHLDRHKQGHNPERPYVCTVCLKGFKRKEHLNLHFIIHSGEKNHVCTECGKRFYRKDHLRKHTRSHLAKRIKAELSQAAQVPSVAESPAVPLLH